MKQQVKVNDLPETLQSALKSVGYGRADILVRTAETVSAAHGGFKGCRAFTILVNIDNGQTETLWGSWGGANIHNPSNPIDLDTTPRPLPPNGVVIEGSTGGGRPVYASITAHPSRVQGLLPSGNETELPIEVVAACVAMKTLKSAYRKEAFEEWARGGRYPHLGTSGLKQPAPVPPVEWAAALDRCVELGLAKRNKAGACQITTEGKNVALNVRSY